MTGVHPAEPRKPSASEAVLWASMIALIFAPLERAIVEASAAVVTSGRSVWISVWISGQYSTRARPKRNLADGEWHQSDSVSGLEDDRRNEQQNSVGGRPL